LSAVVGVPSSSAASEVPTVPLIALYRGPLAAEPSLLSSESEARGSFHGWRASARPGGEQRRRRRA